MNKNVKTKKAKEVTLAESLRNGFNPKRNLALSILDNCLLQWDPKGIYISVNTLEMASRVLHPCSLPPFQDTLFEFSDLKKIKKIESIEVDGQNTTINGIKYSPCQLDAFPVLPDWNKIIQESITRVPVPKGLEDFVGKDEMRQAQMGVNLSEKGWGATNAHILIATKSPVEDILSTKEARARRGVIIPVDMYKKMTQMNRCYISLVENEESKIFNIINAVNEDNTIILQSRLIDASFPDYNAVIPDFEKMDHKFTFHHGVEAELQKATNACNKKEPFIQLSINGTLEVEASDVDRNIEYKTSLPITHHNKDGEIAKFLINPFSLEKCLKWSKSFGYNSKRSVVSYDDDNISVLCCVNPYC